jgi:opacity protein-like surface antigen
LPVVNLIPVEANNDLFHLNGMTQDNNIMKNLTLISTLTASLFTLSAHADLNNFYVEGAAGQAKIDNGYNSETDTSMSLLGGYKVFANGPLSVSTEVGYNRYLSIDSDTPFGKASNTISSLSLGGKVGYEVAPKLQVFGRLAYEAIEQEVKLQGATASLTSDEFTYGVGASYEVAEQLTVGTQYKFAQLDNDIDLSNVSVSVGYQF